MYCNSFPIVLNMNHSFSNFQGTWTHFNHIWIISIYYIYIIIIIFWESKKNLEEVEAEEAIPQRIQRESEKQQVSGEASTASTFYLYFTADLGLKRPPHYLKYKLECSWFATFYTWSL